MTSPLLLVTEVPVQQGAAMDAVIAWHSQEIKGLLYQGIEALTILELTPLASLTELADLTRQWRDLYKALSPLLIGDVRRQVLEFVEAPKGAADEVPNTPYLQLRHVEVKPPVHEEYLAWRKGTIFAEVHKSAAIETFLAYHSLLSTEPGIMFIAGFSCAPEEYLSTFVSDRYAEIARQARSRFLASEGFYTRIYRRVSDDEGCAQ
jgi:hypothetical protein